MTVNVLYETSGNVPKTSAVWAYCQGTNIPYIKITETK